MSGPPRLAQVASLDRPHSSPWHRSPNQKSISTCTSTPDTGFSVELHPGDWETILLLAELHSLLRFSRYVKKIEQRMKKPTKSDPEGPAFVRGFPSGPPGIQDCAPQGRGHFKARQRRRGRALEHDLRPPRAHPLTATPRLLAIVYRLFLSPPEATLPLVPPKRREGGTLTCRAIASAKAALLPTLPPQRGLIIPAQGRIASARVAIPPWVQRTKTLPRAICPLLFAIQPIGPLSPLNSLGPEPRRGGQVQSRL
jgi:hypothetical protein